MTNRHATHILVIDDEPDLRTLYELTLLREGYQVSTAADIQEAKALLENQRFDLVLTDMRLPDGMGIDIVRNLQAQQRSEPCIVITAYGSAENAVESLKAGAFDYLTKPVDLKQFRTVVKAAIEAPQASKSLQTPRAPAAAPSSNPLPPKTQRAAHALACLAGESAVMRAVRERIVKVAASMAPVMVCGESGTGKELVAQALHANSHRASGPWVAVNCGAIPENLLEAEFFGAKKGAYTGSTHDRVGFFQAAHGGTLFLDEIGDLPLAMQAKLLRAIQERRIRPLGAHQEDEVDVRIVSATHKNLPQEVAQGRFRQDLFYRLNVIDITIAPLRERREDLPLLCATLLARIAQDARITPPPLSDAFFSSLNTLPLLGNVRELENIMHRAVALYEEGQTLLPTHGQADATTSAHTSPTPETAQLPADLQQHLDQQERAILMRALQETGFNRTLAAKLLGLTLRQIRYRIERLKIDIPAEPSSLHFHD